MKTLEGRLVRNFKERTRLSYIVDGVMIGSLDMYQHGNEHRISNFEIDEEYRNRGYGKRMMALAIAEAAVKNIHKLTLAVSTENIRAQKVYKFCGFLFYKNNNRTMYRYITKYSKEELSDRFQILATKVLTIGNDIKDGKISIKKGSKSLCEIINSLPI